MLCEDTYGGGVARAMLWSEAEQQTRSCRAHILFAGFVVSRSFGNTAFCGFAASQLYGTFWLVNKEVPYANLTTNALTRSTNKIARAA